jgi:putative transposase
MSNYVRDRSAGGSWFFTVVTGDRHPWLLAPEAIRALRHAFDAVRRRYPFRVDAAVLLPDHVHVIWTQPSGDAEFGKRWSLIKRCTGDGLLEVDTVPSAKSVTASMHRRRERGLWQRRFWEHRIRDADDFRNHCDYIHYNPVKHGLVARAADWPHSTFARFVERGWLDADWGVDPVGVMAKGE